MPPKELDDGDPMTTEAGSSPLSSSSSQNDEENGKYGSMVAAGTETTEEEQLAQDKEEIAESPPTPPNNALQSPELNASFDEDEASEEGPDEKSEADAAWRLQAFYAVRGISRKIPKSSARLDLHAEALIAAATSPDDLAQMYEGWTAWI